MRPAFSLLIASILTAAVLHEYADDADEERWYEEVQRIADLRHGMMPPSYILNDAYRYECRLDDNVEMDKCGALRPIACENAILKLKRNRRPRYGAPGSNGKLTGVCARYPVWFPWKLNYRWDGGWRWLWKRLADGCAITIEGGPHCKRSGEQLYWDYLDIRLKGCKFVCGRKYWGNDCSTVIRWYKEKDNPCYELPAY